MMMTIFKLEAELLSMKTQEQGRLKKEEIERKESRNETAQDFDVKELRSWFESEVLANIYDEEGKTLANEIFALKTENERLLLKNKSLFNELEKVIENEEKLKFENEGCSERLQAMEKSFKMLSIEFKEKVEDGLQRLQNDYPSKNLTFLCSHFKQIESHSKEISVLKANLASLEKTLSIKE